MDARIRQLLDTIVEQYEVPMEEKAAELSGPAAPEVGAGSADTRARAARLEGPFALGLQAASRAAPGPLRLISADPLQNREADALIQFLVRPGLATVRTEETSPDQFSYEVSVDWPVLRRVGEQAGVDLGEVLGVRLDDSQAG